MRFRLRSCSALLLGLLMGMCPRASAHDHPNLEEGYPLRVEDAFPIPYRGREALLRYSYVNQPRGRYRMALVPELEVGFPLNTEVSLAVPLIFGDTDKTGSADIVPSILYNFNMEGVFLPAFSVEAAVGIPTGRDSEGVDPLFKLLISKTIAAKHLDRLHLNGAYQLNAEPHSDEREHLFNVVFGYSRRVAPVAVFVADSYYEWGRKKDEEAVGLELGIRVQLDPFTVLSVGGDVGLALDAGEYAVQIGLQRAF